MATASENTQQPTPAANQSASDSAPKKPATTQEELSHDTGEGIRGGYGDSDQTNGLEGGNQRNLLPEEGAEQNEEE